MRFTAAGRSYSITTKNRSGTLTVAPVIGIARYAVPEISINYIIKMWIRTTDVKISVGYAPQIGDIVAVMWTSHSRYNTDDIQYFIISTKNNNIPISSDEVIAHFTPATENA